MSTDIITAEQLTAIKAYATESAACFVDEFPGEELGDSDWDSAAFQMRQDLNAIDGAFEIYRKHLVAEITRLNLQRLHETLTQVRVSRLKSSELRNEAKTWGVFRECYRSSETLGADAIEIVYFPETGRAGVASGSDAEWTDASSAADALRRYLNDDMSL
jgi:hypothetical protein